MGDEAWAACVAERQAFVQTVVPLQKDDAVWTTKYDDDKVPLCTKGKYVETVLARDDEATGLNDVCQVKLTGLASEPTICYAPHELTTDKEEALKDWKPGSEFNGSGDLVVPGEEYMWEHDYFDARCGWKQDQEAPDQAGDLNDQGLQHGYLSMSSDVYRPAACWLSILIVEMG